jgi:hypothetical protein
MTMNIVDFVPEEAQLIDVYQVVFGSPCRCIGSRWFPADEPGVTLKRKECGGAQATSISGKKAAAPRECRLIRKFFT